MSVASRAIGMCTATLLADPMAAGADDVRAAGDAAARAGGTDVSVWAHHLPPLGGLGLRVRVIEAATAWANGDASAAAEEADHLAALVAEHGAEQVLTVCLEPAIDDEEQAGANLAALADRVGAAGARVVVEFLPWTAIPDLATAWRLVEPVGPAAGLVLDCWHWQRQPGGPDFDLLATIPADRIAYVQVCDAAAVPGADVMEEAHSARQLPGDGVVDFAALFDALAAIGVTAPFVATEIFNPALVTTLGPAAAAEAMLTAAERVVPPG